MHINTTGSIKETILGVGWIKSSKQLHHGSVYALTQEIKCQYLLTQLSIDDQTIPQGPYMMIIFCFE